METIVSPYLPNGDRPCCSPAQPDCPVVRAVGALGGKWKLHIAFHLTQRTMRFGELHRAIDGVTQQMLTAQLREMEADGIVHRKIYPEVPPKVEYSLTTAGQALEPVIAALIAWGRTLPPRTRGTPALPDSS